MAVIGTGYTGGDPTKLNKSGYVLGDVLVSNPAGMLVPLGVGPNSDVLTANSSAADGVEWDPSGGGGGGTPSNSVVTEQTFGQSAAAGVSSNYQRGDHTHGTPTLNNLTFTGKTQYGQSASIPQNLVDAATIVTDASTGNHFRVTLGGSRTLANPTNPADGQHILFEIIQDATGSRTLVLGSKFSTGTDIPVVTLSLTPTKRDFLLVTYNLTVDKFFVIAFVRGY
jgi:hypothetical protein